MTLLGIDLGTTSVKAAVYRSDGTRVAGAGRRHTTRRPAPGWAEQDPEDWWDGLTAVVAELAAAGALHGLDAVGICSQVNTHVITDAGGAALHPAITWQDRRCADVAAGLTASLDAGTRAAVRGGLGTVDTSHPAARAAWLAAHASDSWARARWVLAPKDQLLLRLTGVAGADPISSIGLVDAAGAYPGWLDALVPGLTAMLPPLGDPAEILGETTGAGGLPPGIPVVHGTMDAWSSLLGGGIAGPGDAIDVAGTSEVLAMAAEPGGGAPGIVTFPSWRGLHVHAGPTQAGGDALAWTARMLGLGLPGALAAAAGAAPGCGGVLFLPQLSGERAPLWDPHLRAHWLGATFDTGPAELARAGMEGVAHAARHVLDVLEQAAGTPAGSLAVCGGGSESDLWCQIKADVLNRPLRRTAERDAGVLGAALLAGLAVGGAARPAGADARSAGAALGADARSAGAPLGELAALMVRTDREFAPDPAVRGVYDDAHGRYRAAQRDLAALFVP